VTEARDFKVVLEAFRDAGADVDDRVEARPGMINSGLQLRDADLIE
jgi:hypothetical protein